MRVWSKFIGYVWIKLNKFKKCARFSTRLIRAWECRNGAAVDPTTLGCILQHQIVSLCRVENNKNGVNCYCPQKPVEEYSRVLF